MHPSEDCGKSLLYSVYLNHLWTICTLLLCQPRWATAHSDSGGHITTSMILTNSSDVSHVSVQGLSRSQSSRPLWMARSSGPLRYPRSLGLAVRSSFSASSPSVTNPQKIFGSAGPPLRPSWGPRILPQSPSTRRVLPARAHGMYHDHAWTSNLNGMGLTTTDLVSTLNRSQHDVNPSVLKSGMTAYSAAVSIFIGYLNVEPVVSHQTSWLESTDVRGVRQDQADESSA